MTKLEVAAQLEEEVQATLQAWNIEELVQLNEAAEAMREDGFYNTKALQQLSRGF